VDWVHGWWTTVGSLGPSWSGGSADRRVLERGGALAGVGPPTTPKHRRSPAGVENGGQSTGILLRASLELGWRYGSRVVGTKWWRIRNMAMAALKLWERGWVP
jgi:hypothetical protein